MTLFLYLSHSLYLSPYLGHSLFLSLKYMPINRLMAIISLNIYTQHR